METKDDTRNQDTEDVQLLTTVETLGGEIQVDTSSGIENQVIGPKTVHEGVQSGLTGGDGEIGKMPVTTIPGGENVGPGTRRQTGDKQPESSAETLIGEISSDNSQKAIIAVPGKEGFSLGFNPTNQQQSEILIQAIRGNKIDTGGYAIQSENDIFNKTGEELFAQYAAVKGNIFLFYDGQKQKEETISPKLWLQSSRDSVLDHTGGRISYIRRYVQGKGNFGLHKIALEEQGKGMSICKVFARADGEERKPKKTKRDTKAEDLGQEIVKEDPLEEINTKLDAIVASVFHVQKSLTLQIAELEKTLTDIKKQNSHIEGQITKILKN